MSESLFTQSQKGPALSLGSPSPYVDRMNIAILLLGSSAIVFESKSDRSADRVSSPSRWCSSLARRLAKPSAVPDWEPQKTTASLF